MKELKLLKLENLIEIFYNLKKEKKTAGNIERVKYKDEIVEIEFEFDFDDLFGEFYYHDLTIEVKNKELTPREYHMILEDLEIIEEFINNYV